MSRIAIESFGPSRPWVHPGEGVAVTATIRASSNTPASLTVTLLDLDQSAAVRHRRVLLGPAATDYRFRLDVPRSPRHGYGLLLRVEAGGAVSTRTAAIEAIDGWWESPRHAAVTDYSDAAETGMAIAALASWHVNVVQHYDWMWRHYRYRPPGGATVFVDSLGRTVDHDAVRVSVDAGHTVGIASLAYGSVYGAEREYVEEHPDERVFGAAGEPLSLDGTFFINDLRPDSAWRRRLLGEYADAIDHFGFDGIHMDTYGPPHHAFGADGEVVEFEALYPGLIAEAQDAVEAAAPDSRLLFNCVEGFPLESVAPTVTAALYLELWPPDRAFVDVVRWIDRARALVAGRQVVIAAYAATLRHEGDISDRTEAFEAVVLLGSVIAAAGAYHHTLAEAGRLLVEGYYPAAVRMHAAEARELQALWRFSARYVHLLSDPDLELVESGGIRIYERDGSLVRCSDVPRAGCIWVRVARVPDGGRVVHLVDLRGQADDHWDEPKVRGPRASGLRLEWDGLSAPVAASPWSRGGDARPLRPCRTLRPAWALPAFRRWLMVTEAPEGKAWSEGA